MSTELHCPINGGRERHLIVIDALDEAGEAGRNLLVEMLARNAQYLPDWLGLIVTSRPESDVRATLRRLNASRVGIISEAIQASRQYKLLGCASAGTS